MNQTIIKDVIHKFVHIPELCRKFMDTYEFNRLKRIKQLGLAHYVYPSATHTRFEHSVGVMCIAGKVATLLGNITEREKELLQLAGLFHDAGHTALSHLMDYILEEKQIAPELAHHEYRSIFIVKQINNRLKLLSDREIEMVSKMILGDVQNEEKPFLFEIINNKEYGLDIDRLDYLQRDTYHIGGLPCFQINYILGCLRIKDNRLALIKKARSELETIYETRKQLFFQVYRYKTVMKAEKIVRDIIEKLDITGKWFEQNWLSLDDCRLHTMMEDKYPDLVDRLYTRKWDDFDEDTRFDHVHSITKEEIEQQLDKVRWTDF